nr:hypothetical protein CFP56_37385 [Quercus suber]
MKAQDSTSMEVHADMPTTERTNRRVVSDSVVAVPMEVNGGEKELEDGQKGELEARESRNKISDFEEIL